MEIDFAYLGPFSVPILQKNVSTLMFCHEKLIMRTFFTHVAITDQNWVYFFTPSALMIAHSAMTHTPGCPCLNSSLIIEPI